MRPILYLFFLIHIYYLPAQNIVRNGDFEELRASYISGTGCRSDDGYLTYYTIDSYTRYWIDLFRSPYYYNSSVPSVYNGLNADSLPRAFSGKGYAMLRPHYQTTDTVHYKGEIFQAPNGDYKFYSYWCVPKGGFCQKLRVNLLEDTTYIVS